MGEYVKKKKDMVFQSVDSLQQVVNVVNEAAAADHDDVLISRVLRLLRAAVHGKPFRLRQNDVVLEIRVYVGLYIFGVSP